MPRRYYQNIQLYTKRIIFDFDLRYPITDVLGSDKVFGSTFFARFFRENPQPNIISVSPTFGDTRDEVISKMLDTQNQLVIVDDFILFRFEKGLLDERIKKHPSNQFLFLDSQEHFGGFNYAANLENDIAEHGNIYTLDYIYDSVGKFCEALQSEPSNEIKRLLHRENYYADRFRRDKSYIIDYYEAYPLEVNAENPFKAIPVDDPEDEEEVFFY